MILRSITDELLSLSKQYPIISVTGARQCGKTTLIKEIFKNYDYINLEEPSTRRKAAADPTSFLKSFNNNVIIDEAQYVPDIFSSVQYLSDADERPGRFIISGSQNFLLLKNITQSLAGRVAIIKLPTLTYNEVQNFDPSVKFEDFMIEGSYPRIYNININHTQFYLNYIETYIARDVKDLLDVKHLREFKEVMVALASRSGQLLNYSELSKFVQVDQRTIKS